MTEESNEITFETLKDAIDFVEKRGLAAQSSAEGFRKAFTELTGMEPARTVNALDVVKICYSLFGEPKGD